VDILLFKLHLGPQIVKWDLFEGQIITTIHMRSLIIGTRAKYKEGYLYFEKYYFESNENIIYDPHHPGKSDKDLITKFLLDRDVSIEQLAIKSSDEPFKTDLKKKYADIIRNEKLKSIGIL